MVKIDQQLKFDFKDVLIRPKRSTLSSRSQVSLDRTYTFRNSGREWTGVPIFAANMDTTGTFEMAIAFSKSKLCVAIHKHYTIEEWIAFAEKNPDVLPYVAVSAGSGQRDFEKLIEITSQVDVNFVCLDVANGYAEAFVECIRRTREALPNHTIVAGNVVTGEMTEQLILSGADIVKVGIGPGSVCTTRKKTGVGYPQLSAVLECADAAHGLGGHIISDGGCAMPGDFSKAFGAGADFVMAGGMFSGHDESGGEKIEIDGKFYKLFYGMSSSTAMKKYSGGVAAYRSSEGKTVRVPYKGPVEGTLLDIMGGIRSTCTYVGARRLKELCKRTTFIRCTATHNTIYGDKDLNQFRDLPTKKGVTKAISKAEN